MLVRVCVCLLYTNNNKLCTVPSSPFIMVKRRSINTSPSWTIFLVLSDLSVNVNQLDKTYSIKNSVIVQTLFIITAWAMKKKDCKNSVLACGEGLQNTLKNSRYSESYWLKWNVLEISVVKDKTVQGII